MPLPTPPTTMITIYGCSTKQEAAGVAAESPWDEGLVYHP